MHGQRTSDSFVSGRFEDRGPAPQSGRPLALMTLVLIMGFVALTCGGLLIVNGLGMPRSALDHSPFDSFLIPGLLLAGVVGGSMLLSARLIWFRHPLGPITSLLAGWILLGWIVVEAEMVPDGRALQVAVLIYAFAVIGLAWRICRTQLAQEGGSQ